MKQPRLLLFAAALFGALAPGGAHAGLWKPKEPSRTAPAPSKGKASKVTKPSAKGKGKPAEPPPAGAKVAGAKVAVFAFHGDRVQPVRAQVLRLLRAKGMKVNATLRPVDSAEQYREMAGALNLVAYIDGEVNGDGPDASATVHVRSGRTGLRMASATFAGERRALPGNVGRELWPQLGGALARACADAAKPRRTERAPMRINAGTPIADD